MSAQRTAAQADNYAFAWRSQTALPPLLEGLSFGEISVRSASVTGDASCVMVRGKLRPGFDLELELEWVLPGTEPTESESAPTLQATAEPEPPSELAASEASSEDEDDDDVPAEKDDGSTRGKVTIAATDLDDEDDLVINDVKVTKGAMEPYDAGKLLDGLREPVHAQLQAFKQAIVASCSG